MAGSAKRYVTRQAQMFGDPALVKSNPYPNHTTTELGCMMDDAWGLSEEYKSLRKEYLARIAYYKHYMETK